MEADASDGGAVGTRQLDLLLTLEPSEALTGCLAPAGGEGAGSIAFSGWVGLLEALEVFRRRAGHLGSGESYPPGSEGCPGLGSEGTAPRGEGAS